MKIEMLIMRVRIFDEDGTLSFTSLYQYVGAFVCVVRPVTASVVALLTLILIHANLKKLSRHKAKVRDQQIKIDREVQLMKESSEFDSLRDRVKDIENEQQKLIQLTNLSRLGR